MTAARTRVRIKGTGLYVEQLGRTASIEPAFDGASQGPRFRNWTATTSGVNALVGGSLTTLRSRSRDTARKNPWARQGVETHVANLVGSGIKPLSRVKDEAFREAQQEAWLDWTDEADADGLTDYYGLQAIGARALQESGEFLIRFRSRRMEDGLTVPLQLQLLEGDHLPIERTLTLDSGNRVIQGVEFNLIGQRVAYWIYRQHPGDIQLTGLDNTQLVRVPASEICHVFKVMRPGQVRGYPWLATVLTRVREMLEYEDAELVRKKFAAMITAFLTTSGDAPEEVLNAKLEVIKSGEPGVAGGVMEPGTTQILQPGEDIRFSESPEVGQTYDVFMKTNLRAIAAGMGLTYEQLTGDLSNVNFSSIRAGLNEFQRRCTADQEQTLVFQMCRPVWNRWNREAVLAGVLDAPGFALNPRPWLRVEHIAQGWRYVNPKDEVDADIKAIRGGLNSRRRVVSGFGVDVEVLDREIAEDSKRADNLGLVLDSDPRKTKAAGSSMAPMPGSDPGPGSDQKPAGGKQQEAA